MQLYTIKDFAKMAKLKESHIRSLIFKRAIPYVKLGRLIRFREQDLIEFLQKNSVRPTENHF